MENRLLCGRMRDLAEMLAATPGEEAAETIWQQLEEVLEAAGADEIEEIALPVLDRSLKDVRTLLDAWDAGSLPLSGWDKGLLKRALKAYRKRLKILRLDDMSSSTHSPLSKGGMSAIQGIKPPEQYPQEVWNLLVAQDRLRDAGNGLLELGIT